VFLLQLLGDPSSSQHNTTELIFFQFKTWQCLIFQNINITFFSAIHLLCFNSKLYWTMWGRQRSR